MSGCAERRAGWVHGRLFLMLFHFVPFKIQMSILFLPGGFDWCINNSSGSHLHKASKTTWVFLIRFKTSLLLPDLGYKPGTPELEVQEVTTADLELFCICLWNLVLLWHSIYISSWIFVFNLHRFVCFIMLDLKISLFRARDTCIRLFSFLLSPFFLLLMSNWLSFNLICPVPGRLFCLRWCSLMFLSQINILIHIEA